MQSSQRYKSWTRMLRVLTAGFVFLFSTLPNYAQVSRLKEAFNPLKIPSAPDYSNPGNWAALPHMKDASDTFAGTTNLGAFPQNHETDVFFLHPTSYTFPPVDAYPWNASLTDANINKRTDAGSIRYQASVFQGFSNIYAPRYRQAHYDAYLTPDTASARRAFEVAYTDIKAAFLYYLQNYYKGKPMLVASHSQGTTHALRLLKEFFDEDTLRNHLVCAYLIGMPVYDSVFVTLRPCSSDTQTGCYCSWRTYAAGYYPKGYQKPRVYPVCTNPLTWKTDSVYAPAQMNTGGILRDMRKVITGLCDAQVRDGVLRIHKPHFKGNLFLNIKNYHIADYNLFYMNLNSNARIRTDRWLLNRYHP